MDSNSDKTEENRTEFKIDDFPRVEKVEFPSEVPKIGQVVRIFIRYVSDPDGSKKYPIDGTVLARTFTADLNPVISVSDLFEGTNRPMVFALKNNRWINVRELMHRKLKPLIEISLLE